MKSEDDPSVIFFSRRRRHTRLDCDWSSDVCSSELDVILTCARGSNRVQMPENILAAMFFVTKQLGEIAVDQRQRRWTRRINEPLAGKTLGILGLDRKSVV